MLKDIPTSRLEEISSVVELVGLEEASRICRVSPQTIKRYMNELKKRQNDSLIIGVIGDTHEPFCHSRYLDFVYDTFQKYKVNKVVHIGDLVDNHAISKHQTETDAMSPEEEYELAKAKVRRWAEAFPEVILLKGNHDKIPARQLATLGIPECFLKSFHDLWELPDTWEIVEELVLNNCWFFHGTGSTGKTPAFNRALNNRMSTIQGHAHSAFGCMYHANAKDIVFGLDVGCGIDNEKYAFRYGKPFPRKPILGCGIVYSDTQAVAVPMSDKYFG
jgi:predicted phosphodiesterase